MKHKTVSAKKHPLVINNINKTTIDVILRQEKPDQLLALYLFYAYVSTWQKETCIHATTKYTATGLRWSIQKVRQVKKRLKQLDLIDDVVRRSEDGKHISGHYIDVKYIYPTHREIERVDEQGDKCSITISKNAKETLSRRSKICSGKRAIRKFDKLASTKLYKSILTKKNMNIDIRQWPNTFRLLRTKDKVDRDRIKQVLLWYIRHIGEDFVPVAFSAKTFRSKFLRIEEAMNRQKKKTDARKHTTSGMKYRMGPDGEYGYYDDSLTVDYF